MYEDVLLEIKTMMDKTMEEFIYEQCDVLTTEHMRYSILDRFSREFITTSGSKVYGGYLEMVFVPEKWYPHGIRAILYVEFVYPFRHYERVVSTAYCQ